MPSIEKIYRKNHNSDPQRLRSALVLPVTNDKGNKLYGVLYCRQFFFIFFTVGGAVLSIDLTTFELEKYLPPPSSSRSI